MARIMKAPITMQFNWNTKTMAQRGPWSGNYFCLVSKIFGVLQSLETEKFDPSQSSELPTLSQCAFFLTLGYSVFINTTICLS